MSDTPRVLEFTPETSYEHDDACAELRAFTQWVLDNKVRVLGMVAVGEQGAVRAFNVPRMGDATKLIGELEVLKAGLIQSMLVSCLDDDE